jgi:hypothetical protein
MGPLLATVDSGGTSCHEDRRGRRVTSRPMAALQSNGTADYIACPKVKAAVNLAESRGTDLITWPAARAARAQDVLFVDNTVQCLYGSRVGEGTPADVAEHIRPRRMGQACAVPKCVGLVIDDVERADPEFPNNLIDELARIRWRIPETRAPASRPQMMLPDNPATRNLDAAPSFRLWAERE